MESLAFSIWLLKRNRSDYFLYFFTLHSNDSYHRVRWKVSTDYLKRFLSARNIWDRIILPFDYKYHFYIRLYEHLTEHHFFWEEVVLNGKLQSATNSA